MMVIIGLFFLSASTNNTSKPLKVTITGITRESGDVDIEIYADLDDFFDGENVIAWGESEVSSGSAEFELWKNDEDWSDFTESGYYYIGLYFYDSENLYSYTNGTGWNDIDIYTEPWEFYQKVYLTGNNTIAMSKFVLDE
jgi:hypothetical protein